MELQPNFFRVAGSTNYETTYRFIDFEGVKSTTTVTSQSATLGGKKYYDASGSGTMNSDFTASTTLCARYLPISYQVHYNVNGGTGSIASTNHTYDNAAYRIYSKQFNSSGGSRGEYLNTGFDLAPYIETKGMSRPYALRFDYYSDIAGAAQIYLQNGNGAKHAMSVSFNGTTSFTRYNLTATPTNNLATETKSLLAFWATHL
jgi:hypothetical protein